MKSEEYIKRMSEKLMDIAKNKQAINPAKELTAVEFTAKKDGISTSAENTTLLRTICMTSERNALFLPCYHVICCLQCGINNLENCVVCRQPIEEITRVFL